MVAEQRRLFAAEPGIPERTTYEGIGEGGDRSLRLDRRSEDIAFAELERLHAEGVDFLAISEERGEVAFGRPSGLVVVIDPIDGSLNARRTIPAFSLSLAFASGPSLADVELAFVHDFGPDEEFTARRGGGAFLRGWLETPPRASGGAETRQAASSLARVLSKYATRAASLPGALRRSPAAHAELSRQPRRRRLDATGPGHGLEVVGIEAAKPERVVHAARALSGHAFRLRSVGSIAITVCWIAAGRFDGMLTTRPCRSVDIAAGQLIAREAGAEVRIGGLELDAAPLSLDARYQVVSALDAGMLDPLLAALRAVEEGE
jgi:myo-inositol-1(or 4)-monophosphatase